MITPHLISKTCQFISHCNGDSHSSKTANIILPHTRHQRGGDRPSLRFITKHFWASR